MRITINYNYSKLKMYMNVWNNYMNLPSIFSLLIDTSLSKIIACVASPSQR